MNSHSPIEAVFFDLDGTLLDTAPDLADACNYLLTKYEKPAVPFDQFRDWIHGGAKLMVCQSFQITPEHEQYSLIHSEFLKNYQQRLTHKTQFFAGTEKLLDYLETQKIPWGIITNKLARLVQPLLDYFKLSERCCCVVSGDSLPNSKPHPAPLLHACQLAHVKPQNCFYVGDTMGDIQAAQAAGMNSIAVKYGYMPKEDKIAEWGATALAANPAELLKIISLRIKGLHS